MAFYKSERYTATRLAEEGWKREFSSHCDDCDEDIEVYTKWGIGGKKFLGIIEGTQEVHSCQPKR